MFRSRARSLRRMARQAIRFGLAAVKNVGGNAIDSILEAREEVGGRFKSLWEFCEKVDLRVMNKRVIESLIKAGAMDSLGKRGPLMAALDKAMERAQRSQKDRLKGQTGLFGLFEEWRRQGRIAMNCRRPQIGKRVTGWPTRKRCWGFLCQGIRWIGMRKSCVI